jgi:AcrR family transcriptional regulator
MRVDAARNLDAVLQTGARLLADDPTTSVATIAAEAGVDRRTVHRRFAGRQALLCAVFHAKLAASRRCSTRPGSRRPRSPWPCTDWWRASSR